MAIDTNFFEIQIASGFRKAEVVGPVNEREGEEETFRGDGWFEKELIVGGGRMLGEREPRARIERRVGKSFLVGESDANVQGGSGIGGLPIRGEEPLRLIQ